ncbi:MAG TPA: Hg(II)-responsive transcriptional regulator [Acidiferrobacteraceae bacterium]|nr:Hg(II)-responsive transcriptional regulator [Acidiferrobacteraceae bacterium]
MTIGRLARVAGVNVETVRYYQRLGIIKEPPKPIEGYRLYPPQTVERLRFIKRAQQLGFSLKEIHGLLEMGDGHCDDVRKRAEEKRIQITDQIKDLNALRTTLDRLIQQCDAGQDKAHCPIVETLAEKTI